jgi:MoxR-like ATPase
LPEAQVDRFLLKIRLGYLPDDEEVAMLDRFQSESPLFALEAVTNSHEIGEAQLACTTVYCDPSLKEYCVHLVQRTREHPDVALGSSPRGSLGLLHAGQARAAIAGRDYVLPDDIKYVAPHVLTHRIMLRPTAELRGLTQSAVVDQVLDAEVVPMAGRRMA